MGGHREPRNLNLGRWLLWAGLVGLGVSFWIPWAVAERTARTEERADRLAGLLLATASPAQALVAGDRALLATLLARVRLLAATRGVFADDLELLDEDPPAGVLGTFANKHYLFQLAFSPPPDPRLLQQDSPLPLPLEVVAWPREGVGPAHAVFFSSEIADAAFTRNLQAGYLGLRSKHRPQPGKSYRRDDPRAGQTRDYRGGDDERWLLRRELTTGRAALARGGN
jgi:hypothetical protein